MQELANVAAAESTRTNTSSKRKGSNETHTLESPPAQTRKGSSSGRKLIVDRMNWNEGQVDQLEQWYQNVQTDSTRSWM